MLIKTMRQRSTKTTQHDAALSLYDGVALVKESSLLQWLDSLLKIIRHNDLWIL
jgi:hypothetical protein